MVKVVDYAMAVVAVMSAGFLEKEDDPRPLHLGDACGYFINYSHKT